MRFIAWRLEGTTRHITYAAFVTLTPGTIVALERVLRGHTWG
jgi:hypothetical protein